MGITRLSQVPGFLLFQFYAFAMRSGDQGAIYSSDWDSVRVGNVADYILETAAEKMGAEGLIDIRKIPGSATRFTISELGIRKVEEHLPADFPGIHDSMDPHLIDTVEIGDACIRLNAAISRMGLSQNKEDSPQQQSDEPWAPLKIDRTIPEYQEAVSKLEDALTTIRGDNGYAQSEPEERNSIVSSLQHGIDLIRNARPTRAQITSLVLSPLHYLATKFVDSGMGIAATAALSVLLKWLGIL